MHVNSCSDFLPHPLTLFQTCADFSHFGYLKFTSIQICFIKTSCHFKYFSAEFLHIISLYLLSVDILTCLRWTNRYNNNIYSSISSSCARVASQCASMHISRDLVLAHPDGIQILLSYTCLLKSLPMSDVNLLLMCIFHI